MHVWYENPERPGRARGGSHHCKHLLQGPGLDGPRRSAQPAAPGRHGFDRRWRGAEGALRRLDQGGWQRNQGNRHLERGLPRGILEPRTDAVHLPHQAGRDRAGRERAVERVHSPAGRDVRTVVRVLLGDLYGPPAHDGLSGPSVGGAPRLVTRAGEVRLGEHGRPAREKSLQRRGSGEPIVSRWRPNQRAVGRSDPRDPLSGLRELRCVDRREARRRGDRRRVPRRDRKRPPVCPQRDAGPARHEMGLPELWNPHDSGGWYGFGNGDPEWRLGQLVRGLLRRSWWGGRGPALVGAAGWW